MYKKIWFLFLLFTVIAKAQELSCHVTVNAQQIAVSNSQMFKTLEKDLNDLMNKTKWTNIKFQEHEKIKCAITILLTEQNDVSTFSGSVQVQASRPVFNTTYYTPILNHKDDNFTFTYKEFTPLVFNVNYFQSDLVSVMSYYSYLILGLYVDSFDIYGGESYLKTAQNLALQAQQNGSKGWENSRITINRFTLIDQLVATEQKSFRKFYFDYHFNAMDNFERNQEATRSSIKRNMLQLFDLYKQNPNSFLVQLFLNAKADELVNIYRLKSNLETQDLVDVFQKMSPSNSRKWKQINN